MRDGLVPSRHAARPHPARSGGPHLTDPDSRGAVTEVVAHAFPRSRAETCRTLANISDVRTFRPGQTIVAQGDDSATVLVIEGHVALRRTTLDGREVMPRIVSGGNLASSLPIAGRPSAMELLALSHCRAALWSGEEMEALAAGDAGLGLDLIEHVLVSFDAIVERMDGLLYQNAARRVARILQQHSSLFFGQAPVLTRAHLPALVGTSREMTGRVLRTLEARGVIERTGRDGLRLLDPERLSQTAAAPPAPHDDGVGKNFLANRRGSMRE